MDAIDVARRLVRPTVTGMLTVTVIYGAVTGNMDWDVIATAWTAVVSFWFGERSGRQRAVSES